MVMGGYIAHYQVHTSFPKGYPGKFLPITCATPIGRVGSTVQNLALKSQIFLPNKSLRTLRFFFAADYGAWDLLKKIGGKLRSCAPESTANSFLRTLVWFGFRRNSTAQIVYLTFTEKKSQRNLVFRPLPGRNSSFVLCSGLLLIQCLDLFLLNIFFSAELHLTKCVLEFCWSCFFVFGGNP